MGVKTKTIHVTTYKCEECGFEEEFTRHPNQKPMLGIPSGWVEIKNLPLPVGGRREILLCAKNGTSGLECIIKYMMRTPSGIQAVYKAVDKIKKEEKEYMNKFKNIAS